MILRENIYFPAHRRQAALHEIQRLKVEGTLRPVVPGAPEIQENGSLTVSAITLPIKRENVRNLDSGEYIFFFYFQYFTISLLFLKIFLFLIDCFLFCSFHNVSFFVLMVFFFFY